MFEGHPAKAREMFRDAAQVPQNDPIDPALPHALVWTALVCGETDFVSGALSDRYALAIHVKMETKAAAPRPRQAILCTVQRSGLTLDIPAAAITPTGLTLLVARLLKTLPLFVECHRNGKAEGIVTLNIADAARFPGVGYCANTDAIKLIPDPDYMASRGYESFLAHIAANPVPWAERRKVAFWRGATTGRGDGSEPSWASLPRVKLCQAVQGEHAALFDAGISRLQLPPDDPGNAEIKARGYIRPFVSNLDFQKFRYQIDIDGYTSAWSALFQKLATGSPVLKVQSLQGWRQWYYDRLRPWQNYVPVAADLSDLADKTRWLIEHDAEAQEIGAAGRALALSLTYESQLAAGAATIAAALVA
jgi:hypothetical protein